MAAALAWLLPIAGAEAARRTHYFQTISSSEGLAQNTVHAFARDGRGFVWVATQGGLHRYDGYGFVLFQHDPADPHSLPENLITALIADGDQRLWIGTNSSFLAELDLRSGQIRRHRPPLPTGDDPGRDRVASLRLGPDGSVWVATAVSVERYLPETGQRQSLLALEGRPRIDRRGVPRSVELEFDGEGQLWVASDAGLHRIDPQRPQPQRIGDVQQAFGLHRDGRGRLWAATVDGVYAIDAGATPSLTRVEVDEGDTGAVWRITSDRRGRLWLALLGGGLLRLDPETGETLRLNYAPDLPASLPEAAVLTLMVDPSDLLWVGTEARGIATARADGARFPLLLDTSRERDGGNNIRALLDAADGQLWVGTESDGLKRVDPASGRFESHVDALHAALRDPPSARGIRVLGLEHAGDGGLWVGSDHGVFHYDPVHRRARLVSDPVVRAGLVPDSHFRFVRRGSDGSLWIGTFGSGLARYWPERDEWRVYAHDPADPDSIGHGLVSTVYEDPQGRVWIGTVNGLNLLEPDGRLRRIEHDPARNDSLSGNLVRAVQQSADGRLWIATHSGLNQLLGEGPDGRLTFRRYGVDEGLPSNTIYGIREDRAGALWLATNLGLARLTPGNGRVRRFGLRDGLQDLEFNGGAEATLADGRIALGGIRGINLFDPLAIEDSRFQPPVELTSLRIGNVADNRLGISPLASLRLPQAERVLRLRFAALDYTAPAQNRFQYRLEGFDPAWIDAGDTPEATFTNLDAGHYRLQVRATNHDGAWSQAELSFPITVVPPWWNSRPAQLAYALALAALLVVLVSAQRRRRRAERRLLAEIREREERLKLSLWGSGDEFWDWDVRRNTIHRIGADQLLDMEPEQQMSTDEWRGQAVHPDDLPRVQRLMQAHLTGQSDSFESEHRIRNARGEWIWVRSRGKLVERDAAGNPLRVSGTARDITSSRRAEGERRVALEVLRSMGEAVAVIDLDFRFVAVNPAFSRITGYSEDEVRGQPSSMLDSEQHSADFYQRLRDAVLRVGHWKGEIWQRRRDGEEFLGWIELSEVRDGNGDRTHYVAVVTDITDKKRAEQELMYLANYDTLTGLPNRALLAERLSRAVVRARRQNSRVATLFLDLDRFKDVNDSLGHAAGDRLLKAAAAKLLATVRETDTVARLGGDEFTVVLEDLHDPADAEEMAARIIAAFAEPLDLDGRGETVISPSIGIALYPDHGSAPTDLLKFADTAMYEAKARGRNTWQLYNEAMDAETRRRATVLAALRRALERGEFQLLYQPKLSLAEGRITGVEALLRWRSAELGEISPVYFIPLAEETGLILSIGEWVLREAALTLARWRDAGVHHVAMAVNVSMLQFLRSRLPEHVAAVIADTGIDPGQLELEVTESMVMANAEQAIRVMRDLKRIGVTLAIDDFGTGYSSLVYLKRLPIDTLKIDKEFVGDLTTDPDDAAITATVITMAHSLGLNVVAEGVESDEQLQYLREHGCDAVQGFHLAHPLDAQHCLQFIREFRPDRLLQQPSGDPLVFG